MVLPLIDPAKKFIETVENIISDNADIVSVGQS